MSDWKKHYSERTITMEEAAQKIKSGDTVWMGSSLCIPYDFMDALADRYKELKDVTLMGNMYLAPNKILMDPVYKESIHTITMFPNILERMAAAMNNIDFNPVPYGSLIEAVTEVYKANVICVEVCPPDEEGFCNVGALRTNFTPNIFREDVVTLRIGVVNSKQPLAHGADELIKYPVDAFDWFVMNDHDIPSLPISPPLSLTRASPHRSCPT